MIALLGSPVVAPELIGCLLVKRQPKGDLLWGVIVETEAYSQGETCRIIGLATPIKTYLN